MRGIKVALLYLTLLAAPAAAELRAPARLDPHGGIVANQTVTVAGQDFFQQFVAAWRDREVSERYAITVYERPSARWGTQVWIEYAQRRIYQAALPTARGAIRAMSEQAVEVVYQKIADVDVERLLFRDSDLAPDEM